MGIRKRLALALFFIIPVWAIQNEQTPSFDKSHLGPGPISHQNLYNFILESDIKFPEVVFVQAIIESGNFKSGLFKNHNNLFGMRFPRIRKTTATGKNKNGYARYVDWNDSVLDYYFWQSFFLKKNRISNREEYFELLDDIYAEDETYVSVIRKSINRYNHIFKLKDR